MGKMGMEGGAGRGEATVTGCLGGQGHPHCTGETGLMPRSGLFRLHEKAREPPSYSMPLTPTSGQGGGWSKVPRGRPERSRLGPPLPRALPGRRDLQG